MPARTQFPIHYGRETQGLGLYYHASRDLEEREPHGHEEIQVTIPLLSRRPPDHLACGPIEVVPSYGEHATTWGGSRELVIIHFASEFLARSVEQPMGSVGRLRIAHDDDFIGRIGATIRDEIHSTGDVETVLLTTLGTVLAGYICKGVSEDGRPSADHMGFEQIRRAVELINDAIGRQLSLIDVASDLGLSQWHFSRQFRKTTGLSPYQFFMRARIERAHSLLEDGCSISEAAMATGFADQSHLHRHFTRYTGRTPGDIARNVRRSRELRTSS